MCISKVTNKTLYYDMTISYIRINVKSTLISSPLAEFGRFHNEEIFPVLIL
jgi:hypothetical protein